MFFGGFYGRRRVGAAKPKKVKKPDWFSELNATQVKELAKACKLKVSGTKGDVIARLNGHEASQEFSCNVNRYSSTALDRCKQMCRERMLQVGGTKYDPVLRILQSDNGTGGDSLKRAAPKPLFTEGENGEQDQVVKKRKVTPKPSIFASRVQKKIEAVSQKKYQSHWGSKSHAPAVTSLMDDLFDQAEAIVATEPRLAYECFRAIITSFTDNFHVMERPGYCQGLGRMVERLYDHFDETLVNTLDEEEAEQTVSWLRNFERVCTPYCLLDCCNGEKNVSALIELLQGPEDDEESTAIEPSAAISPKDVSVDLGTANQQAAEDVARCKENGAPNSNTGDSELLLP